MPIGCRRMEPKGAITSFVGAAATMTEQFARTPIARIYLDLDFPCLPATVLVFRPPAAS